MVFAFTTNITRDDSITTQQDLRKNAADLYDSILELTDLYKQLADQKLKNRLLDSLVTKYLSLFQAADSSNMGKLIFTSASYYATPGVQRPFAKRCYLP